MADGAVRAAHGVEPELQGATPRRLRKSRPMVVFLRTALNIGLAGFCYAYYTAVRDIHNYDARVTQTRTALSALNTNDAERIAKFADILSSAERDRTDAINGWVTGSGAVASLYGVVVLSVCLAYRVKRRLLSVGVPVIGAISDRKIHAVDEVGTAYVLTYLYSTPHGDQYKNTFVVSRNVFDQYELNRELTILYDPADPALSAAYFTLAHDEFESA